MNETLLSVARSWCTTESPINSTEELLHWIKRRNEETEVEIKRIALEDCRPWFFDQEEGCIRNAGRSFFTITGSRGGDSNGGVQSQPIMLQAEIGFLGIICRELDGVMHFLMQAKIEPGNVNCVQISPTIQATKSNFTQKHGGKKPPYLEYFIDAGRYEIVVDQIQSEQSSRFYKKRNRNIVIRVEEDIPVLPSHCWMTLGQIKRLMREDNLVNMDTRTVLSCLPFSKLSLTAEEQTDLLDGFSDKALFRSVFMDGDSNPFPSVYQYINDRKMFGADPTVLLPLQELEEWELRQDEIVCRCPYPFKVIFCDISIEGREVRRWMQPLFAANGSATIGLICCEDRDRLKFLVHAQPEIGCFDSLELGPTVQKEWVETAPTENAVSRFFWERLNAGQCVLFDHLLSEEGGRFYHEQNRNVLLRVKAEELPPLPEGYFLLDYKTLNEMVQINNVLNIQLRNLLSLMEA